MLIATTQRKSRQKASVNHIDYMLALAEKPVVEMPDGSNDDGGKDITQMQAEFKMRYQYWCGICASVALKGRKVYPNIWSARAKDFIVKGISFSTNKLAFMSDQEKQGLAGAAVVKAERASHVDYIVEYIEKNYFWVVGGNVGNRVKKRKVRLFDPGNRFGYTYITPINYL